MRRISVVPLLALMALCGVASADCMLKPLGAVMELELSAGFPRVNEEFTLTLTLRAYDSFPAATINLTVPAGIELLSGQLNQQRDLAAGESVAIQYILEANDSGAFRVDAEFFPSSTDSFHWPEGTSIYVVSRADTAIASDTALDAYVYNASGTDSQKPAQGKVLTNVTIHGSVYYKYYDMPGGGTTYVPLRDVMMTLSTISGTKVGDWRTYGNGGYSETFSLASGVYYLQVLANNGAACVHRFPLGATHVLVQYTLIVVGDDIPLDLYVEGNPDGWYREDVAQILTNVSTAKNWCSYEFGVTRNFVHVMYPLGRPFQTSFYIPPAFDVNKFPPPVYPWSDAIYIYASGCGGQFQGDIWGPKGKSVTTHEWAHAFMCNWLCGMAPEGWGFDANHGFRKVTNPGFAFAEGFAEFLGPAVWLSEYGGSVEDGTEWLEDYRPKEQSPYHNDADGTLVEGAVMQVFWDLSDCPESRDHTEGVDDDGHVNVCGFIDDALAEIGQTVTGHWSQEYGHWLIRGDVDIALFRNEWHNVGGPPIDEMYNVNLFGHPKPPTPGQLAASASARQVTLTWTDLAQEEGQYLVWKRAADEPEYALAAVLASNSTTYADHDVEPLQTYHYKVAALTCDTSEYATVDVTAPGGWVERPALPESPSGKRAAAGAWLAADASTDLVYAATGNRTGDFHVYDPARRVWMERAPIPKGTENKNPRDGCTGVSNNDGSVFATKGANTLGFYSYHVDGDSWHQLLDVPTGIKKVKGGTGMVYVEKNQTGYVYLLKGQRTQFLRYDPGNRSWLTLPNAPAGRHEKYDKGSWLVYDGGSTIYCHKAKYHEFWRFDVYGDTWYSQPLTGMPFASRLGSNKKSKDGGSAVWYDGGIFALKGGNTQEFWYYDPGTDQWTELDTIPSMAFNGDRRRKVKGGGTIAAPGQTPGLLALKGNKCSELWCYAPPVQGADAFAMPFGVAGPARPPTDDESPFVEGVEAARPRWRQDGSAITYCKEVNGVSQVFLAMFGQPGIEHQLTTLLDDVEDASFDPTGTWIAFSFYDSLTDRTQIGKVLAVSVPTQVIQLTFSVADKSLPEWELTSGQWLVYERADESTGYVQLARVPAAGGPEQILTSDPADHLEPCYLNPAEVLFVLSPDDGYDQLARLNLTNMQQMQITTSPRDHESPCAALGSVAGFTAQDDAGTYQIGTVNANGTGERLITTDSNDLEAPDWQANGAALHCARWFGLTSEICRVDTSGSVQALTDASAIRDNPDTYWNQN